MGCVCLPLCHYCAALPITRVATGSLYRGCPGPRLLSVTRLHRMHGCPQALRSVGTLPMEPSAHVWSHKMSKAPGSRPQRQQKCLDSARKW